MANPKGSRPKSRLSVQKCIPSVSAPAISTSKPCVTTLQGPSSVSSHSSSQISSMFPSTITTKMRTLWTTSHTKALNNFNLSFKKFTPTNPSLSFSHPTPPSSSPNGLPENSSYRYSSDPLSGPTTRHAEYLFSRVNKGLLTPDCYTTPLPSPLPSPLSESLPSSSFSSGLSLEYKRGQNMFLPKITDSDTDTETSTEISKPSPYAWKKLQKSCKKVLDNINTHINAPTYTNLNPSLNISKCDERITGQENGNRPLTHPGLEEGVGYGYDVCTSRRYECRANRVKDLDRNRLIRTRSQESIVEVLFDVNSSSPCALPTSISNPTSTLPYDQNQNQNQNHKQEQEQEQKQEQYHSNKESTHKLKSPMLISRPLDSLGDVQGYTPSSTLKSMLSNTPKKEDERTRRVRISKEVEGLVNVCFHEAREIRGREGVDGQEVVNKYEVNRLEEINTEMSREVLVNNFAYMEMRPKGRVCVESCNEFVSGSVGMVDQREEEGRGGGDDDCGSRYARSELDFEDSTYGGEDEYGDRSGGEAMGYETERSVFARLEKTEMDTNPNSNASITTTTNQPPNNINSLQPTSSIPYLPPLPHPPQINHPSPSSPTTPPSPISQALIHIPRPATPTLNQSPSHISLSLSLTSSIMDSAYLRSSEIQDHLLGYSIESLGYSFPSPDDTTFASGHETEGDIPRVEWGIEVGVDRSGEEDIDGILNYTNYDAEGRRRGRGRGVGEEKGKPQGSRIERENEDESTEEQEPAIQFRLSPCTFPGTGLYLYEPISTPKHTSGPSIIAKPPQDQTEYPAASECRSQSQVQSPHSNVKHDIIATNNHNAQYESRIEKPSLSRSDCASPDVQEHEGDVFLGKEKESRGIMMHFSRSPTGLEGVDGRDVLGAR